MEYKQKINIKSFLEEKIDSEIVCLKSYNEELKKEFEIDINNKLDSLNEKFVSVLNDLNNSIQSNILRYSSLDQQNNILEEKIEELEQKLISKNREIIELETEKKNWNKVSYTKFLDKQLADKKKDLEVMKLRFDHTTKQNNEYRKKITDMKTQIKSLCISNNIDIDIDIDISDTISVAGSNTELSIIEDCNEEKEDSNIKMNITEKQDNNSDQGETQIEIDQTINLDTENKELSDSEETVSTLSFTPEGYEIYNHTNKKQNKIKKYLKKKEGSKTYLFKYVKEIENIGDAVGQIVKKSGVEKASFYRKKKN